MKFVTLGKADIVKLLVKCDGLDVNDVNKHKETAADIAWKEKRFACLLHLLQGEAEFPYLLDKSEVDEPNLKDFLENRDKLHENIEGGDLQSVKEVLKDSRPSMYLNLKLDPYCRNQSALSWAAECHQIEIFAYLINHGAKFKDLDEERECEFSDDERDKLNDLLSESFVKLEDSHILKLMYSSHSPQMFTEERREKIKSLYEYLNSVELVRMIMKVLEYEEMDVVFDFECDHTNRVYCMNNHQIYGLTIPSMKKIFVGASKCESAENVSLEVAGTLAHELCHMAIQVVFRNDAKPYEKWEEADTEKVRHFQKMVQGIYLKFQNDPDFFHPIIQNVFDGYDPSMWHSEIIVRVPHILCHCGQIEGITLLENQVNNLLQFYLTEITVKFNGYSNPAYFRKNLCMTESLNRYIGCISDVDRDIGPLKDPAKSFRNHLMPYGILSVIFSSNTRLCCLHVYHELKRFNPYHMEKRCLFFSLECYGSNWEIIMRAFKSSVCRYMVLISGDEVLDLESLCEDFEDVDGMGNENDVEEQKKVIIILREDCRCMPKEGSRRILSYQWRELSEAYKIRVMEKNIKFKGRKTALTRWIDKEKISRIIQPKDMLRLTSNQDVELGDGEGLIWKGYIEDCYIEREFFRVFVEESVFNGLPDSVALFVTGLRKEDIPKVGINENRIQWVDSLLYIDSRKRIFVPVMKLDGSDFFTDFCKGIPSVDSVHWLHYYQNKFYLRTTKGNVTSILEYKREEVHSEVDLMVSCKDRIILISDDPGMGKSTVITNIIMRMRESHPDRWVGRIDLNDYSDSKENPLGLGNIEEDSESDYVLDILIRMLGMKSKLEMHLFREFIKPRGLNREYKIFLDGYDEVSKLYSENVLKLIQVLIEKTTLQLWVTTRNHERISLETKLETFSYSMKQFTFENQVTFLERYWKYKTKYLDCSLSQEGSLKAIERIRSKVENILEYIEYDEVDFVECLVSLKDELDLCDGNETSFEKVKELRARVDELNFRGVATEVVQSSSIGSEESEFMGIPLHLFMLGNVVHETNFRRGAYSNVHKLYTEFVEGKIRIYWKEKGKIELETNITKKMFNRQKNEIINFHKDIAMCVMEPETHSWNSVTEDEDRDVDVSVGIVTKVSDHFQFIHRTFAEYFYAEKLLEKLKSQALHTDILDLMLTHVYFSVVVRFFYWAFNNEVSVNYIKKVTFESWNMKSIMKSCLLNPNNVVREAKYLLKIILDRMENVCDVDFVNEFIYEISDYGFSGLIEGFRILSYCLTEKMFFNFYVTYSDRSHYSFFSLMNTCVMKDTKEVLDRLVNLNPNEKSSCGTSEISVVENNVPRIFHIYDKYNENVFFHAARNRDKDVFPYVLKFLMDYFSINEIKLFLLNRDNNEETILHKTAHYYKETVLAALRCLATVLDMEELLLILRGKNCTDQNFLFDVVRYNKTYIFRELFDYLHNLCGEEILREMMLEVVGESETTILHCAVENNEIESLVVVLETLRRLLNGDEFLSHVKRISLTGNIFHERAAFGHPIGDLKVLIPFVGEEIFREMLKEFNLRGQTCLLTQYSSYGKAAMTRSPRFTRCLDVLLYDLNFLPEVLDQMSLQNFFLATDDEGNTILHYVAMGRFFYFGFVELMNELKKVLGETCFEVLLSMRNDLCLVFKFEEDGQSATLDF